MVLRTDKDRPRKQVSREKMGRKGRWGPALPPKGMREMTGFEEMLSRGDVDMQGLWDLMNRAMEEEEGLLEGGGE